MTLEEFVVVHEGAFFVADSRVPLASVIYAFRDGASPETIRQNFPSLSLGQVYGAIAYYLTVQEQRAREAPLIRLMEIAREQGVPAAMEEWRRGLADHQAKKGHNSPA